MKFKFWQKSVSGLRRQVKKANADLEARELQAAAEARNSMGRWRIGTVTLDPVALTVQLRKFVPGIRVEQAGNHYVFYSDKLLSEGDFNRIQAELLTMLTMDRT